MVWALLTLCSLFLIVKRSRSVKQNDENRSNNLLVLPLLQYLSRYVLLYPYLKIRMLSFAELLLYVILTRLGEGGDWFRLLSR